MVVVALAVIAACGSDLPDSSSSTSGTFEAVTAIAPTTTEAPTTTTTEPPTTIAPPAQLAGSPLAPGARTIYVLGDSVTLGAQSTVPKVFAGWDLTFDAKESRRIDQGTSIVQARGGAMGRVLVVHLCTNWGGGDYSAAAAKLLNSLVGVERVVWVTCTPWLPAVGDADAAIKALPANYPSVVVADWAAVSATPGYTYSDGLHLKPDGATGLAFVIAGAVGPLPAPA